eukprot:TRINITY_DN3526_c0_g1_i1.p1 TRINITY_DN3526_c0_g1~~TRINITY_DN3526_c0_g1_i1.p1  ORF type:complete len:502 (-),score=37.02 TRINITY_DN3526_c0_g1_i1:106-1611(-)
MLSNSVSPEIELPRKVAFENLEKDPTEEDISKPKYLEFPQLLKLLLKLNITILFLALLSLIVSFPLVIFECYHVIIQKYQLFVEMQIQEMISVVVQMGVLCTYQYLTLWFLYGELSRFLLRMNIIATVFISIISYLTWDVIYLWWPPSFMVGIGLSYVCWIVLLFVNGYLFGKKYRFNHFILFFTFPLFLDAVFLMINDFFIMPLFLENTNTYILLTIRILAQPAFYFLLIILLRFSARWLQSPRPISTLIMATFMRAFFGRVLNNEFTTLTLVFVNSVILIIVDIFLRLIFWNRKKIFNLVLPGETKSKLKSNPQYSWMWNTPAGDLLYAQFLTLEKTIEIGAIILTGAIQIVYIQVSPTNFSMRWKMPFSSYEQVVYRLLIQLFLEVIANFVSTVLEIYHDIPSHEALPGVTKFNHVPAFTPPLAHLNHKGLEGSLSMSNNFMWKSFGNFLLVWNKEFTPSHFLTYRDLLPLFLFSSFASACFCVQRQTGILDGKLFGL